MKSWRHFLWFYLKKKIHFAYVQNYIRISKIKNAKIFDETARLNSHPLKYEVRIKVLVKLVENNLKKKKTHVSTNEYCAGGLNWQMLNRRSIRATGFSNSNREEFVSTKGNYDIFKGGEFEKPEAFLEATARFVSSFTISITFIWSKFESFSPRIWKEKYLLETIAFI